MAAVAPKPPKPNDGAVVVAPIEVNEKGAEVAGAPNEKPVLAAVVVVPSPPPKPNPVELVGAAVFPKLKPG